MTRTSWRVGLQYIVVAIAANFHWTNAQSAELIRGTSSICDWILEGEIRPGDQKRVGETVEDKSTVCLNSPGGSYMEGLALFLHFAEGRIATVVQQRHECSSACAIAFMGGSDGKYGDRFPRRTLFAGARLGFHSPYVGEDDAPPQPLAKGVALGIAIVAALLRSDKYKLMPTDLVADLLETGPDALYYVDTLAKAKKLEINVEGLSRPKSVTMAMLYQACDNSDPWMEGEQEMVDPKSAITPRNVSDKPGLYRVEFGPGGWGLQAMESCAVSLIDWHGANPQLLVELEYVPEQQSLLQRPPNKEGQRPLWYLFPGSTRIFR